MNGARKITVKLPAREFNFEESVDILRNVLSRGGHTTCFSGLEISFTNEAELIVGNRGEVAALGSAAE
jgi:hypothetical protein